MTTVQFYLENRNAAKAFEAIRDRNDLQANWTGSTMFEIDTDGDVDELIDDVIECLMSWGVTLQSASEKLILEDNAEYKYGMFGKYK